MKSKSPEIFGHSIKNPHIIHLLMHDENMPLAGPQAYQILDKPRYVCICGTPTPEKSTWNIEEVTCKNCLKRIHNVLHDPDPEWRKAVYNGQLWDEIEDCSLPTFCAICFKECGSNLCRTVTDGCYYKKIIDKMYNGFKDCPLCGGEAEIIGYGFIHPIFKFFSRFMYIQEQYWKITRKCKLCGHEWW
jgi:hypothetical protein